MTTSIYVLFDENGPRYVGKSVEFPRRLKVHAKEKPWLASCLIIEVVPSEDDWKEREQFWIRYYRQWYLLDNKYPGGNGPSGGKHLSEEHKRKVGAAVSIALKGRIPSWKGKRRSPEHIAKLPQNQKGYKWRPESIAKRALANTGKRRSAETRLKMRLAQLGRRREKNELQLV